MLTLITGATLSLTSIFSVFSPHDLFYTRAEAQVVEPVPIVETLPMMSDRIAENYGVASSTLRNLVWTESRWDPNAVSPTGDCGLVQINSEVNPSEQYVPCDKAKDPAYALNFAAQYLAAGKSDQWVACNCYLYLKTRIRGLPSMAAIVPNGPPSVGTVAILEYKDRETGALIKHVALIESMDATSFTVAETNWTACLFDRRTIEWGDPHLRGFFVPLGQLPAHAGTSQ